MHCTVLVLQDTTVRSTTQHKHTIKYDRTTNIHSELSNKVLITFPISYYDYLQIKILMIHFNNIKEDKLTTMNKKISDIQ
jgi:hypothetical protein